MSAEFEAARAAFVAGVQAFEAGDLARAEGLFLDALRLVPKRPSTLANLAAVRHRLGRPAEALAALDEAVAAAPDDVPAWYHRGQLLQELERPLDALAAYERVLALDAQHGAAWSQRGAVLKDMGRLVEAAHCFEQALAHGGDEELNRYYLASVMAAVRTQAGGDAAAAVTAPPSAPRHYVESLFDSYAEGFDEHLLGKLGYRTPWLIAEMVLGHAPVSPAPATEGTPAVAATPGAAAPAGAASVPRRWQLALDLGCGTGLMGPLLAPHCVAIDGVDLSSQMLVKAHALGCYRRLVHGDVVEHLNGAGDTHELVVAADVFVYIGDLAPVYAGVRRVLAAGGLFGFSVEEAGAGTERFELRASSRYAHSERYVRALAREHGFEVRALTRTTLRHEQRRPIGGLLVLLARQR